MSIKSLTLQILEKMPKQDVRTKLFWTDFFMTMLICRGKYNFTNLARYSKYSETSIRERFSKFFDFFLFNKCLHENLSDGECIISFDPSYIPKSGKHTQGLGKFWSGCLGKVSKGLEVSSFASVGLQSKTAMHLIAKQTLVTQPDQNLVDYYVDFLKESAPKLLEVSKILVADSYFSKVKYVSAACDLGFTLVSKLPSNRILRYYYLGQRTGKRGRPKVYDGRVNKYNPCPKHFSVFFENEKDNVKGYEGIVNIQTLKSKVKCVIIHTKSKKGDKTKVSCCFSTDINMPCGKIIEIYKLRFQIEFLFRDAKQFTGLTQCQARSEAKINTHINASLTAVSLAKALDLFKQDNTSKKVFSMHSLKMRCFNENYIDKIFSYFKKNPKIDLNNVDERSQRIWMYRRLDTYGVLILDSTDK